jgi:hypothetical protein
MKIDELSHTPSLPELVATDSREAGGLDLLGLRVAADAEDTGTAPITLEVEGEAEILVHGELVCIVPASTPSHVA